MNNDDLLKRRYVIVVSLLLIMIFTMSFHVISKGQEFVVYDILGKLMQTIGIVGFPMVIMAYGDKHDNTDESIGEFYLNYILKLIIPYIIYSVILSLISKGEYANPWFTPMFLGLALFMPFIKAFINSVSIRILNYLVAFVIGLKSMSFLTMFFRISINRYIDTSFLDNYVIFLLVGILATKIKSKETINKLYRIGAISFAILFVFRILLDDIELIATMPMIMFFSIALFLMINNVSFEKIDRLSAINRATKFIYNHKVGIYFTQVYVIIYFLPYKFNLSAARFKVILGVLMVLVSSLIISSVSAFIIDKLIINIINKFIIIFFTRIKDKKFRERFIPFRKYILWIVLTLIVSFFVEALSRGAMDKAFEFIKLYPIRFLLNYLLILALTSFSLLFYRMYLILALITGVIFALAYGSYTMFTFRGVPLSYPDFFTASDGVAIAEQYINKDIILEVSKGIIIFIILLFITYMFKEGKKYKVTLIAVAVIPATILLANVSLGIAESNSVFLLNDVDLQISYNDNGFVFSLYRTYQLFQREKPEEYSKKNIEKIKDKLSSKEDSYEISDENPNIILLQLESFMDPLTIDGIELSDDPYKNFREYMDKYSSGRLKVPTFGGGTVRTEFEVLTGNSLEYFAPNEIPYNTVVKSSQVESIAYSLGDDYEKSLVHNNEGSFYGRNLAYENMGFQRYVPIEYMYDVEVPYSWPSDSAITSNVQKIIDTTDKRDLVFGIGVQTHGNYADDYENPNSEIKVSGTIPQNQINQIQSFVDNLVMVDDTLRDMVQYVENLEEPTILLVYSDHLPALDAVVEQFSGEKKYETDYFICDNMGLKKYDEDISAYEITTKILKLAGKEGGVMNKFHNVFKDEENYNENLELLQYDLLFGAKYITDGKSNLNKTKLTMGITPIIIESVEKKGDEIYVHGSGFNKSSSINIGNKQISTEYKSYNQLIGTIEGDLADGVSVSQLSRYDKKLGTSEIYKMKD